MKMLFKQRLFSWFDSYDIYDEKGNVIYIVEGKISWGHKLHILDKNGIHIATVKQAAFTFLPRFELYVRGNCIGVIQKQFKLFKASFHINYNGWEISGNFMGWDYKITDLSQKVVATISKDLWNFTDTYVIDVGDEKNGLYALMVALAIDAEKCSGN